MARTKNNKKRNIWFDILAILLLAVWAYFADYVFEGAYMEEIDYPLIGSTIAGVVSVSKVWVFLVGVLFYLLTSTLAMSRFIGWLGSMIVMTEIMIVEPIQKFKELVTTVKGLGETTTETGAAGIAENITDIGSLNSDAEMALERYGIFPWKSDLSWVRMLTYIGAALMLFMLIYFIVIIIKDRKAPNTTRKALRNSLIFLAILAFFIFVPGLIMGTGPQWLFISFMTLLAFVSYMYGTIKRSNKGTPVAAAAVTIVLMIVLSMLDMCYRMGSAGLPI